MERLKGLITGAALGTFLGSLTASLYPKRLKMIEALKNQTEYAKQYTDKLLDRGQKLIPKQIVYRDNYWKGGVVGALIGAGLALFLSPKTGKQLRTQATKAYTDFSNKTQHAFDILKYPVHPSFSHNTTSHNAKRKRTPAKSLAKHKVKSSTHRE